MQKKTTIFCDGANGIGTWFNKTQQELVVDFGTLHRNSEAIILTEILF